MGVSCRRYLNVLTALKAQCVRLSCSLVVSKQYANTCIPFCIAWFPCSNIFVLAIHKKITIEIVQNLNIAITKNVWRSREVVFFKTCPYIARVTKTLFSDIHISRCDVRRLVTGSLGVKMPRFVWMKSEAICILQVIKEKSTTTEPDSEQHGNTDISCEVLRDNIFRETVTALHTI